MATVSYKKSPNSPSPQESTVTAKLPPQNIEAEQSLLGSLLIDKDAIINIAEILRPEHFYKTEMHGSIYNAIVQLFEKREPIDLVTVTEKLKQADKLDAVGGSAYLAELVNMVPTAAHVETYAKIIREHALRRTLISQSTKFVTTAYDESIDVSELLESCEQSIFGLSQQHVKRDFIQLKDALAQSFDRLDEIQKTSGKLRGVPSGFRDLDSKLAGFQDSNLIIFAARPGMGKCLAYDSKIVNPQTGEVITIQDYYQQKIIPILTLDPNLKLHKTEVGSFVDDGQKEVFEVITATGRKIEVTASHPFLCTSGWKKLFQLRVGDKIATPREIPVFGMNNLENFKIKTLAYFLADGGLTGFSPRFTNSNDSVSQDFKDSVSQFESISVKKYTSNNTHAPSYEVVKSQIEKNPILQNFSLKLIEVIKQNQVTQSYLAKQMNVSAGSISHWTAGQSIPSENNLSLLSNFFDKPKDYFLPSNFFGFQAKSSVTLWLEELNLMGKGALEKKVPSIIFSLTKEKLALFLNRLFTCDGSAHLMKKGACICYSSSSPDLIYDVQHLLLRFGILSKIRVKKINYKSAIKINYELEIRNSLDIIKFCQNIGIFSKEEKTLKVIQSAQTKLQANNFSKDTLPVEIWDYILKVKGQTPWAQIYKKMGLPSTHNIHVNKRNPKRSTVLKLGQALNSQELINLATSDIFWDEIISIKSSGLKQVYDLTIPETHNFVANDFFVHNTSFALNVAQHIAVNAGLPIGIFSLEMSQEELVDRLLVGQADIDAWKLKTGKLDDKDYDKLSHAMGQLAEAPLFIDDTPGISLSEIRTKARRLQSEHGLRMIIIDYLQLIKGRNLENRVQEVSEISQGLKNLARELKVPVLSLSQLNRQVENRGGNKKPQLADLRESGAIEQDADVVMFIYREDPENMESVTLAIEKHRNGPTGEIPLIFRPDRVRFYGMERARKVTSAPVPKADLKSGAASV